MFTLRPYPALLALVVVLLYARPALAFGAGNIASMSKVEGQNCKNKLKSSQHYRPLQNLTFVCINRASW